MPSTPLNAAEEEHARLAYLLAKAEERIEVLEMMDLSPTLKASEGERERLQLALAKAEEERDEAKRWEVWRIEKENRLRAAEARERELREALAKKERWEEAVHDSLEHYSQRLPCCQRDDAGELIKEIRALQATQEDAPKGMCAGQPTHVFHPDAKEGDKCLCGESAW